MIREACIKMKKLVGFAVLVVVSVFITNCSPPKGDYAIANISGENLQLDYEVVLCSSSSAEEWTPAVMSHENFLNSELWESDLSGDSYVVSSITNYDRGSGSCSTAHYQINVPPEEVIRITNGDYSVLGSVRYLRMSGAHGTVTFEEASGVLKKSFENYQSSYFRPARDVLWY